LYNILERLIFPGLGSSHSTLVLHSLLNWIEIWLNKTC